MSPLGTASQPNRLYWVIGNEVNRFLVLGFMFIWQGVGLNVCCIDARGLKLIYGYSFCLPSWLWGLLGESVPHSLFSYNPQLSNCSPIGVEVGNRKRGKNNHYKYTHSITCNKVLLSGNKGHYQSLVLAERKALLPPDYSSLHVSPKRRRELCKGDMKIKVQRHRPTKRLRFNYKIIECLSSLGPYLHTNRTTIW